MSLAAMPGRLARVSALALVGLLTQVPAGARAASPEASASPGPSASPGASTSPALPVVQLVRGRGPGRRCAIRYVPGTSAAMTMDMDTTIAMGDGGSGMPSYAAPTMRVVVETTTGERTPAGTTRLEYRYLDAGVVQPGDGFADAFLDGWLDQYVGITMWSLVDDRGQAHGGGIEGVEQLDPLLASAFEDIETSLREASAPFPLEPVGVGARWAVEQSFASQGLDVTQRISYTLLDRGSDWVELGLESTLSAERAGRANRVPGDRRLGVRALRDRLRDDAHVARWADHDHVDGVDGTPGGRHRWLSVDHGDQRRGHGAAGAPARRPRGLTQGCLTASASRYIVTAR
ncbi:MAG: hypothetical protein U0667_08655 [Chloroflexota bacterium]